MWSLPLDLTAVVLSLAASSQAAPPETPPGVVTTSIWTGFSYTDLDGQSFTEEVLTGRVVLVDFWATWCVPCIAELPYLRLAYERYGDRDEGLEIVGISLDQGPPRELRSFLVRQGISWPQLHDGRGFASPLARRFAVDSLPRSFLVDREGRLIATDLRGARLLAVLSALFEPD